jgi:hypothetical protein
MKVSFYLDKVICNNCGSEYISDNEERGTSIYPFSIHFGYESNQHDMEHWRFDLCEKCIEKLIREFKIPPNINYGDAWGNEFNSYKE